MRQNAQGGSVMINFINTFLSQIILMVIIVAVAGAGTGIGITWAKKKNAQAAASVDESSTK